MSEKMKFVYTHCGDLQYGVVESAILCNNCGKALKVPIPEPPQPSPLREQIGVIVNHWGCYDRHIPQMPDLNDLLVGLIMQAVQQWYGGIIEGMPTDEIGVNTFADVFSYNQGAIGQYVKIKAYLKEQGGL